MKAQGMLHDNNQSCGSCGTDTCRFSFKLSPGQVPLETECPLLLKPKHGVFMTPVLRTEE